MAKILASVGLGGINRPQDVGTVQTLLNLNMQFLTPLLPLRPDRHCGLHTIAAIKKFQAQALQMTAPDGRVDPGGKTFRHLCAAEPKTPVMVKGLKLPDQAEKVLKEILVSAGLSTARVTSVSRTPAEQARIMYENCVRHGAAYNKTMYAKSGDTVIGVYENNWGKPRTTVIQLMLAKIQEVGPSRVSSHISDTHYTFDVAPSSIPVQARPRFVEAIRGHKAVSKLIAPPIDPAYHIEIPKNSAHL